MSQRLYAAAQALSDFWIPMRGHRELFLELELGQAAAMLAAADEVCFSDEQIARAVLATHVGGGVTVEKAREIVLHVIEVLLEPATEFDEQQIQEVIRNLRGEGDGGT